MLRASGNHLLIIGAVAGFGYLIFSYSGERWPKALTQPKLANLFLIVFAAAAFSYLLGYGG